MTKYILPANSFYLLLFVVLSSCHKESYQTTPAFYHWQTNLALSQLEKEYLRDLPFQKIYPKFFDVDWDFNRQEAVAKASLVISTPLSNDLAIIPTIFITNRTLVQLRTSQLPDLAQKISQKLKRQISTLSIVNIQEIQFDCDWTQSTKEKYFHLLTLLTVSLEKYKLSATIRLHQIKYKERTGVPPVTRGMLMYYNMGEVQKASTINSILDHQIGQQYLKRLASYPLPLDVALPLFQWGVLFRNDKMIKLLNQLTEIELSDSQRFSKKDKNHWEVTKSTYLDGVYLYENDVIRLEKVIFEDLEIAAQVLSKQLKKEDRNIVFYHLDPEVIQQFATEELQRIIKVFSF